MTDYHNFTTPATPLKERRRLNVGDIWNNAVRCKSCNDVIRSTNRHDFKTCSCGSVSVDGGSWYLRRAYSGSSAAESYEELSETFDDAN